MSILDGLKAEQGKFWLHLIFNYWFTAESKPSVKCKFAEFGLDFEKYSIAVMKQIIKVNKLKYLPVKEPVDGKPTFLL